MKVWLTMADTKEKIFNIEPEMLSKILTDQQTGTRCDNCPWAFRCHPIVEPKGTKLCTLDFKKKLKLSFTIDEVC